MEGKGNSLIILLRGPPGTDKTLTADSVTELANKPLYRVTYGDIGIDPESIKKYLKYISLKSLYIVESQSMRRKVAE